MAGIKRYRRRTGKRPLRVRVRSGSLTAIAAATYHPAGFQGARHSHLDIDPSPLRRTLLYSLAAKRGIRLYCRSTRSGCIELYEPSLGIVAELCGGLNCLSREVYVMRSRRGMLYVSNIAPL